MRSFPHPVLWILALLAVHPASAAQDLRPDVVLSIVRTSPAPSSSLPRNGIFYIEVSYRSPVPLRIHAGPDGRARGRMTNPSIRHPAGHGTALAWFGYQDPAWVESVTITASDDKGRPLARATFPVALQWHGQAGRSPVPEWVAALRTQEERLARQSLAGEDGEAWDPLWSAFASFMLLSVPLYLVMQAGTLVGLKSGWRRAAIAPLLVMVPAAIHAVMALLAGSNIWPMVVILAAPFCVIYLLFLLLARLARAALRAVEPEGQRSCHGRASVESAAARRTMDRNSDR